MRTLFRTHRHSLPHLVIAASLALGVSSVSLSAAHAACAIAVGEGEGPTQAIAERRAMMNARAKAGGVRPSNASFSEPMCFVADNFTAGIAIYGCQVEYSYCTDPAGPVVDIATPPVLPVKPWGQGKGKGYFKKWKKHHKHWKRHHGGKAHGRIEFGGWQKQKTVVSCLNFNARASARTADHASELVNDALMQSVQANVGGALQTGSISTTGPQCSQTGSHKVTCLQSARFCY